MSQEDAIVAVIEILKEAEGELSDGYIYYADDEADVERRLRRIAERIVNSTHLLLF